MKHLLLMTALLGALFGCSSTRNKDEDRPAARRPVQEAVVENARKNVSWQGTYQGILPCSACEGVATMIVLNPNMTYTTRTRMLGIDDKDRTGEGRFEWLPDNSHIAIDSEGQRKVFRVHNDRLEMRMPNGDAIPTTNPEAFQLMKTE